MMASVLAQKLLVSRRGKTASRHVVGRIEGKGQGFNRPELVDAQRLVFGELSTLNSLVALRAISRRDTRATAPGEEPGRPHSSLPRAV